MAIFSGNRICKQVKTHLEDNGFDAENHFGKEVTDFDKMLQQVGKVFIFYDGADYEILTNEELGSGILLTFLVVDQTIGTDPDKDDYHSDKFRDYVCPFTSGWKDFGIPTIYPDHHFEIFKLESERIFRFDNGKSIAIFKGHMDFSC